MGNQSSSSSVVWEGKNVVITGASSGIGRTLALQFAAERANLVLVARSPLTDLAKECQEMGAPKVMCYACDLTKHEQIRESMHKAVADFKGFDVVVLNAGRSQGHYFEEIKDVEQIDYLLKLNVNGVINTLHYLLPSIYKTSQSRIVIMSSTAGIVSVPYRTVYCASKFALTGFSGSLRMELNDVYQDRAPKVCLINFPEVAGTDLNTNRMEFGADQPPAQWDVGQAIPVDQACQALMVEIAKGTREWGHPTKVKLLRPLSNIIPEVIDSMVMKHIKKTTFRPADSK